MKRQEREIRTAVVTGPTGAIGNALCQRLLDAEVTVYAVTRPGGQRAKELPQNKRLHILPCNLDEIGTLPERIGTPADALFHLAWGGTIGEGRNDAELQLRNVGYTVQAAQVAAELGCKVFIGAGSQAEYCQAVCGTDEPFGMREAGHRSYLDQNIVRLRAT